jgi:putative transposase
MNKCGQSFKPTSATTIHYAESLLRTLKYWPAWPNKGFDSLDKEGNGSCALWIGTMHRHRHSGIQFVTPSQRHQGLYQAARLARPKRRRNKTRNWSWQNEVQLNPNRVIKHKNSEDLDRV